MAAQEDGQAAEKAVVEPQAESTSTEVQTEQTAGLILPISFSESSLLPLRKKKVGGALPLPLCQGFSLSICQVLFATRFPVTGCAQAPAFLACVV